MSFSDELFIGAVAASSWGQRPWGAISWVAEVFGISRPTVYALGKRIVERVRSPAPVEQQVSAIGAEEDKTNERLKRLALTCAFPGKVTLRPMQEILHEALGETCSIGTLSQFFFQAGQRAGEILRQVDHSPLGPVIVVRDETYWQEWPILLIVEPVTTTILLGMVSPDCQAETWGAALLVAQDRGASITGLIEDMARMYPHSQELAGMDVDVQKDSWHVSQAGKQVRCDLEREALAAIRQVDKIGNTAKVTL